MKRWDDSSWVVRWLGDGAVAVLLLTAAATADAPLLQPGQKAPDFVLTDTEGNIYRLSELTRQGPVLLQFACLMCDACPKELPYVERIQEAYKDKGLKAFVIFREGRAMVEPYAKRRQSPLPFLLDSDRAAAKRFGVDTNPTVILVSKDGKVISVSLGFNWRNVNPLSEKVAALLNASKEIIIKSPPVRVG
jgi:peroxiredoxin